MHAKKGLLYRVTDEKGNTIGVPIKASSIYGNPTLRYLEKQFKLNEMLKQPHKVRLIKCIEDSFGNRKLTTKSAFVQALNKEGIYVLFRQNEEGRIYGVTFVDNKAKVVFNGSDLGKAYGAKAITDRLSGLSAPALISNQPTALQVHSEKQGDPDSGMDEVLKDLTTAKQYDFSSPDSAMKRRRRKKRKGRSL